MRKLLGYAAVAAVIWTAPACRRAPQAAAPPPTPPAMRPAQTENAKPTVAQRANVPPEEVKRYLEQKQVFLLDVREPHELKELGTIPGYINIPLSEIEQRLDEIPKDQLILTA
jgi:3-mercaptopyruvate sulfurtransferase SseA